MNTRIVVALIVFLGALIMGAGVWYYTAVDKKGIPRSFEYEDLSKWRHVDPELVTYEEKG